jgi:exodeoxyribonuclease V beta subunit
MKLFDAKSVDLHGINLIEASAGTGKTFTLAELYCRLVTEKQLEVSQILVVTYTRAATEELRGRLRQRLVDERQNLLKKDDADQQVLKRLKLAIQSFDEAAIFTIHGFCQRALQDFAFESGHFFDMEMVTDEQDIKQAVVDDFWRRHVSTADSAFARFLLSQKLTPETLLNAVGSLPGKPYLHYLPLPTMDVNAVQQQVDRIFAQLQKRWQQESEQAIATIRDADILNGNKYRKASIEGWIAEMQQLMASQEMPGQLFEKFIKFTRSELEGALKKNKVLPELVVWDDCQALFDAMQMLMQGRELQLQHLHRQLADYLNEELPKRKLQSKVQAFDDLLTNLQQALHGEQGPKLAARIRRRLREPTRAARGEG